jgi:hypothetical protein
MNKNPDIGHIKDIGYKAISLTCVWRGTCYFAGKYSCPYYSQSLWF